MRKAFTLIELLVVVLIIGILSAVALPQYNKAVKRAQGMEAIQMLSSLRSAAKRYYLANSAWPTSLDELDISYPSETKQVGTTTTTTVEGRYWIIDKVNPYIALSNKSEEYMEFRMHYDVMDDHFGCFELNGRCALYLPKSSCDDDPVEPICYWSKL